MNEIEKGKPPAVTQLFAERMKREGRSAELKQAIADVRAETGQGYGQCKWAGMRKCGYRGPEVERDLYAQWLANTTRASKEAAEAMPQPGISSREEEYADIPTYAHPSLELEWVLCHDILSREHEQSASLQLTDDECLRPHHGPAPSLYAVLLLEFLVDLMDGGVTEERQLQMMDVHGMREFAEAANNSPFSRWVCSESAADLMPT